MGNEKHEVTRSELSGAAHNAFQARDVRGGVHFHQVQPTAASPAGHEAPGTGLTIRLSRRSLPVLVAGVVLLLLLGGCLGAALTSSGDDADAADGHPTPGTTPASTPASPGEQTAPDTDTEDTDAGAPAGTSPVHHRDVDIPAGHAIQLRNDPLVPEATGDDPFPEGDFALYDLGIALTTDRQGNQMVLLDSTEQGSLDTCRTASRYTRHISRSDAPAGSQICLTTALGDVALVTVNGYAPADSPSQYVSVDLTVWYDAVPADQ